MGELYREKYTKEQFLEKLKKAAYYAGDDFGFELTLKENDCEENPYYYEITNDDRFDDFKFKLDLTLSYENEDYLEYDYDCGQITLNSEYACFCLLSHEYARYISVLRRKIEDKDYYLQKLSEMIESGKFNSIDAMAVINKALGKKEHV